MFRPMLAPNKIVDLDAVQFPISVSIKYDGIRCIFKDGKIYSRAMKEFTSEALQDKFYDLKKLTEFYKIVLDGELYDESLTFQELYSTVMTFKEKKEIPDTLKFYCFDAIIDDNYNTPYEDRYASIYRLFEDFPFLMIEIESLTFDHKEVLSEYYSYILDRGYEGLILRRLDGRYKQGRATMNEGIIYKLKPYHTFDGQIIKVNQATKIKEGIESELTELNYKRTSKKKGDRELINKASSFTVLYEGKELKVPLSMTDIEKEEVWNNIDKYLGKWIEYKGLLIGAKNVPRHPYFIRFRDEK